MDPIDEYEQGERVRTWLRNNGSSLIGGVVLGLACLGGWQWWQGHQDQQQLRAADEYYAFSRALESDDDTKASAHAAALEKDYAKTPFPAMAALRRAEHLNSAGKPDEALAVLDGVETKHLDPMLTELVQLRAARLLLGMDRPQDALVRLDAIGTSSYPSVSEEIRGDAEMALGRRDQARAAYEKALASLDIAAPTRPMVEMKLTDAGGSPNAQPEA